MQPVELSIIIPSLNQAAMLPSVVRSLNHVCTEANLDIEIIISDDASSDDTIETAKRLVQQYPRFSLRILHRFQPRRGYGAVVRYGLAHAVGTFAVIVSADGQNPVEQLPQMLLEARNGAQLVQCSRYTLPEISARVPRKFRVYQAAYRKAARILLGGEFPDATYGFKLFDRVLVMALGLSSNRFSLSPEITFKVFLSGGTIKFVAGGTGVRSFEHPKFSLPSEISGHAYVLLRSWLHRLGVLWF